MPTRAVKEVPMKEANSQNIFGDASQAIDAHNLNWNHASDSEHLVQFYETEEALVASVTLFLGTGFKAGGAVAVFATKAHLESIEERLRAFGVDVADAREAGTYVPMDAAETLPKLLVDGKLDAESFTEIVEPIVKRAAAGGRPVRVFGEMVALLWAEQNYDAAIILEECWNRLQQTHRFLLLCGYPIDEFAGAAVSELLAKVCREHSRIIPADGYMALATPEDRLRAVALLQQRATALQSEITEKSQADERLRASENRYRRLFEEARDGILMVDPETHLVTDANPSVADLLGFTREELLDQDLLEIGLFEDREAVSQALPQLIEEPVIRNDHLSIRTKWGQPREVELVSNLYQANGHKVIQCNLRDITERKHGEEIQAHLAAIVESSDDGIISKSLDGTILSWNRGAERIFGYTAEEVIGKSIYLLIPPERREEEPRIVERLKRGDRIDHYETVRVAKDGSRINISLTVSPIRDGSGKIIAASKVARDITERRRAEQQLSAQAKVIETTNRIGQVLSAEMNLQIVMQTVTEAATQLIGAGFGCFFPRTIDGEAESFSLYGISREVFSGAEVARNSDLFDPPFQADGVMRLSDVHKDPRYGKTSPFYGIPPEVLPITSYLAVPVISRSGQVLGGLFFGHEAEGVFTDRDELIVKGLAAQAAIAMDNARLFELSETERAKAEAANRAKDDFLATISHELRTPLNAIIGWSHMLQRGRLDEATVTHAVRTIERNAKAQAQLIEDILDVSRVMSGKLRLNNEKVDIASVINAAVDSVQLAADSKDIKLRTMVDTSVRHTLGDSRRLQQVIWNLLSNAIKFTPSGGRVEILLERIGSDLQVKVSDTGEGINSSVLPYVFDRFYQADVGSTRRHGGLGLGLAIVRHLIELHGGSVHAESPGEGCGTTFTFRLPLVTKYKFAPGVIRTSTVVTEPPPSLEGVQILVVDDDPDTLQIMSVVLAEARANVQTAASAAEALEMLRWSQPDVLVSDLGMPNEDGYSLIRRLRARESDGQKPIPAVALTAYVRVEDRVRALSAGFNMFVPKPVEPNELITAIASVIEPRIRSGEGFNANQSNSALAKSDNKDDSPAPV
jgi:PAS domain S-box-containing protein